MVLRLINKNQSDITEISESRSNQELIKGYLSTIDSGISDISDIRYGRTYKFSGFHYRCIPSQGIADCGQTWDATGAVPGFYFYRLAVGEDVRTRKMLVVR